MEVTINGEHRQLVGNPPAVGEDVPHFKVFDKDNQKIKTRELFSKPTLISVSTNTIEDQQNWCAAEGVKNMKMVADSEQSFGYALKVLIPDEGILARSIWVLDADGKIVYEQVVPEVVDEPDYDAALAALKKLL